MGGRKLKKEKRSGKVRLTPVERQNYSAAELVELAAKRGYTMSRATAARAIVRGWFKPEYRHAKRVRRKWRYVRGWVMLTTAERRRSAGWLSSQFGISIPTARRAIRRGWFEVNIFNVDKVDVRSRVTTTPPL